MIRLFKNLKNNCVIFWAIIISVQSIYSKQYQVQVWMKLRSKHLFERNLILVSNERKKKKNFEKFFKGQIQAKFRETILNSFKIFHASPLRLLPTSVETFNETFVIFSALTSYPEPISKLFASSIFWAPKIPTFNFQISYRAVPVFAKNPNQRSRREIRGQSA